MSFPATFPGTCGDCGERIHEGDEIVLVENRGYVHDRCPDPTERRAPVCERCFTEKPCGCDDEVTS